MAFSWRKKVVEKPEFEEEMSMEEILSSIRKYVIDEKRPALATSSSTQELSSPLNSEDEDVIELTQSLDTPETVTKKDQQPASITPAVVTPILSATAAKQNPVFSSSDTPETSKPSSKSDVSALVQSATRAANIPSAAAVSQPQPPMQEKRQQHTPFRSAQYPFHPLPPLSTQSPEPSQMNEPLTFSDKPDESLVSSKTASDTAQAFARLAEVAQQPMTEHKPVLKGDTTIEQFITEVTKPIIKTWLDQNLAPLVEAMVAKEIERIVRR